MIKPNHSPILAALVSHVEKRPQQLALITEGGMLTYVQLWQQCCAAAHFLRQQGLQPGERVALVAHKHPTFLSFYLAAHLLGLTNVLLDPTAPKDRLETLVSASGAALVLGTNSRLPHYLYDDPHLLAGPALETFPAVKAHDIADILWTSGTSGLPKGVLLSHANIAASARHANAFIQNTADDVELVALPLCHSFGLGRVRCNLLMGATMVWVNSFANLKTFFEALTRYAVTGFSMVPSAWHYMQSLAPNRLFHYASQLRFVEMGSAPLSATEKRCLLEGLPHTRICMHYGLTEASRATYMEFHEQQHRLSTIGRPATADISVRIWGASHQFLSAGQPGEIVVKGDMVMRGYMGETAASAQLVDGYLKTGDLGYFDETGYFYLMSRKSEVIHVGGRTVSPVEIEQAILDTHLVKDCLCVAMPDPHGILGEVPKVSLLPFSSPSPVTLSALRVALSSVLPPYKMPQVFEWTSHIPTTPSGKKIRT